jgi:PAP2 superfamily
MATIIPLTREAAPPAPPRSRHRGDAALPTSLLPADRLFLLFNTAVLVAFLSLAMHEPRAYGLVAVHLLALALPALLRRLPGTALRWVRPIRELYPVAFLALYWAELGVRFELINGQANDALIAGAELALFGLQPSLVWRAAMPSEWLNGIMQAAYAAYYPLLIGIPLLALASRRPQVVREVVLRLTLTYLACFLVYTVFPVAGPRVYSQRDPVASSTASSRSSVKPCAPPATRSARRSPARMSRGPSRSPGSPGAPALASSPGWALSWPRACRSRWCTPATISHSTRSARPCSPLRCSAGLIASWNTPT